MIKMVLPTAENKGGVLRFYEKMEKNGDECIGFKNRHDYERWLAEMTDRRDGKNLPQGYVRENFYLCYDKNKLIGVFSLKFELTSFLLNYGGHVGYAVTPEERNKGYATEIFAEGKRLAKTFGFERLLATCDEDNVASERVIVKNGGILEDKRFDDEENAFVKRFWVTL